MIRSAGSHQSSPSYTPPSATFRNMKKEEIKGVQGVDDRLVAILLLGLHTAHHKTKAAPPLPAWRFSIARATSEVKTSNKLFCGLEVCQ